MVIGFEVFRLFVGDFMGKGRGWFRREEEVERLRRYWFGSDRDLGVLRGVDFVRRVGFLCNGIGFSGGRILVCCSEVSRVAGRFEFGCICWRLLGYRR